MGSVSAAENERRFDGLVRCALASMTVADMKQVELLDSACGHRVWRM
jgi:hypothetical protein